MKCLGHYLDFFSKYFRNCTSELDKSIKSIYTFWHSNTVQVQILLEIFIISTASWWPSELRFCLNIYFYRMKIQPELGWSMQWTTLLDILTIWCASIIVRKNIFLNQNGRHIIPARCLKFLLRNSFTLPHNRRGRTAATFGYSLGCPKGTELDVAPMYRRSILER